MRGSTAGENATAEVVIAGDGATEQVVELSGAGDGTGGWVTDAVDVSRFGGEVVTVQLRTAGNAIRLLRTENSYFVISATNTVNDYRGETIDITEAVNKATKDEYNGKDYDDWDHNPLGETPSEVASNLERLFNNPDEVYEITENGGSIVTIYIREMAPKGNDVVLFAKVVDSEVITSFVPTLVGRAPPDTDYEDVYDRTHALNYIIDRNIRPGMGKIKENTKLIPGIEEGETVKDSNDLLI